MAKVKLVTLAQSRPLATGHGLASRAYLDGPRDPLHLRHHTLAPGAVMQVAGEPTDRLAYVLQGLVSVCGQALVEGSSMIAEYGAEAERVGGREGAVVLTFNQAERPADARPGGHIHILPRAAVPATDDLGMQNEMGGGIHADAACPTCTVWLHENDFHRQGGTLVPLHSHSEDEIIFVTRGRIALGNRSYGPGTALAVAANTIYGFDVPEPGLSFINFRAASPTVITSRGMMDEAQMWISRLGKPHYACIGATGA